MATIIGHTLAGLVVSRGIPQTGRAETLQLTALCIGIALLPDVDMLPGLRQGAGLLTHGGAIHSVVGGVVASAAVALVYRNKTLARWQIFVMCFVAYSTHLLLDYAARDGFPPHGIPLWWPFTSVEVASPTPILMGVHHNIWRSDGLITIMDKLTTHNNLRALTLEVVLIMPFLVLGQGWRMLRARRQRLARSGSHSA